MQMLKKQNNELFYRNPLKITMLKYKCLQFVAELDSEQFCNGIGKMTDTSAEKLPFMSLHGN